MWPTGLYPSLPSGAGSCNDTDGCHQDTIHVFGLIGGTIANNIMYGGDCQGIFFEPTNGSVNSNINIIGNAISSLASACSNKSIYVNANGSNTTAGTWNIGFNSGHLLDVGDGFSGTEAGTTFNLYGNYMDLFLSDVGGNRLACTNSPTANTTITFQYNTWTNPQACSGTDTASTTTPAFVNDVQPPRRAVST